MEDITKIARTVLLAAITVVCLITWLWLANAGLHHLTDWSEVKISVAVLVFVLISVLTAISFIGDVRNEI